MAWDPSPSSNVVGYVVYYGGTSGSYPNATNVSNQMSASIGGLQASQTYFFAVAARDSLGAESARSSEISYQVPGTTLPTVALTAPLNGASYTPPASISLAANVTANGHTITKVQFYNGATLLGEDTSSPYSFTWNSVAAGSYSLTARVVYDAGSTVDSAAANVLVANPSPSIALTSPIGGATFTAPATIGLAANVTANGHTITKVQFYSGAALLGEDTSSPYSFTWSNAGAGSYSLTARAVYDSGSTVNSTAASVAVANPPGAGTVTFSNSTSITIADAGAGTPYPSAINVSGLGGTISQLTVTLKNLSHTWPNDVDVLLVGPAGQKVMIFSDVGGPDTSANNVTLTLADGAATALPATAQIVSGTFQPTDLETGDVLPAPAPVGPYATTLSAFNGLSPNGTWSLYVNDDGPGDQGIIGGGWSLAITTTGAANAAPTITDIAAQSTTAGTATAAIPFTVNDAETPASNLLLAVGSSNPTLVPNANIVFGGSGGNRTVTVTPASGQSGSATITVTVTDANGSSVNDTFVLTVTNPLLPTVALTSPLNGATYTAPALITMAANVAANGHTITKVQFYTGTTLLGEDTSSPYSLTWTGVGAGSYHLMARVVYDAGSTADSASANVAVTNLLAPTIALTSPITGTSYAAPATVNLAASVTANGHTITKVQFYNGATLLGEDTTTPYSFAWNNVGIGSYSASARVVYDSGSTVSSSSISLNVGSASAVTSIWPSTAVPGRVDQGPAAPRELGVKFLSDVAGTITGIRFYKASANTGTHVGHLWTSTGTLLASGTFANETASGWQQVIFATPVTITPNTVYVASYSADNGHYSLDSSYFTSTGVDNPPLHALADGQSGGNGVYNNAGTFPNQGFYGANFWVDVVFQGGAIAGLTAPWQTANIGDAGLAGNATGSNGVYTVQGAGNIAGRADSFRFVYQPLSGDGDITARINSMTTNGDNRCVGVMIRESLAPNSKYAFMGIGQNLKFRWQRRTKTGASTSSTTSVLATPPNAWSRLVRSNDTVYAYSSTNGVNWTKLTSISSVMATNIYVGFVVASGSTNTLNTSVFSNVSVTP